MYFVDTSSVLFDRAKMVEWRRRRWVLAYSYSYFVELLGQEVVKAANTEAEDAA